MAPIPTTTLSIRNVDTALREKLRLRAARHGRSMEAELRAILRATLSEAEAAEPNLAEAIRRRLAPQGGVELEPFSYQPAREPPDFAGLGLQLVNPRAS